jgi:hypothetical protein
MSSGKKPKTVAPPDPRLAIREQGIQNRVGQINPFGSALYEGNDQTGYNVRTQLSPEMQGLLTRTQGLAGTDSVNQQLDPRVMQLAGSLMQRINGRFTGPQADPMQLGSAPMRPSPGPVMPQMPPQQMPPGG